MTDVQFMGSVHVCQQHLFLAKSVYCRMESSTRAPLPVTTAEATLQSKHGTLVSQRMCYSGATTLMLGGRVLTRHDFKGDGTQGPHISRGSGQGRLPPRLVPLHHLPHKHHTLHHTCPLLYASRPQSSSDSFFSV